MINLEKKMFGRVDWFLFAVVMVICLIGILAILNATADPYASTEEGIFGVLERINPYYARLQAIWIGAGLALMAAAMLFDYRLYGDLWLYIYIGCCALLLLVLVLGGGPSNVRGWFNFQIGDSLRQLQPAEFAKVGLIAVFARLMSRNEKPITRIRDLLLLLGVLAVPVLLVVVAGEYGSAMVYIAIFIGMLFMSGINWKLLVGLFTTAALSLVPLWFLIGEWRQERILSVLDPSRVSSDATYQVDHARLAIGAGQTTGRGLFQEGTISQLGFLPAQHTDFIFSVTAEAVGFVGCLAIVLLYLAVIIRLFMLAGKTTDRFGALIIVGVASMYAFHVFINISMNIGIMPVVGIPLPFMSYGGSAMLTNLAAIGLVMNVRIRPNKRG